MSIITNRYRETGIPTPIESFSTNTLFKCCVPYSIRGTIKCSLTILAIPLITIFTIALIYISFPNLTIDTFNAHWTIKVEVNRADTFCTLPNLTTNTGWESTLLSIPIIFFWANTFVIHIMYLTSSTGNNLYTESSIPIFCIRAFATISIYIPFFSICAVRKSCTRVSVPFQRRWAFTSFSLLNKNFSCITRDTTLAIPICGWRAFACIWGSIKILTFWAFNYTLRTIPYPSNSATQTKSFRC